MNRSIARVETERASIHLQQLCKHFAHRLPVSFTPEQGRIDFSAGICRLGAANGVLTLEAEAGDAGRLEEVQNVVEKHLARFAFRAPLTLAWTASPPA